MENIFEKAARAKLRFETKKGRITTEDLWDLPLQGKSPNLDEIAMDLFRKAETGVVRSFVTEVPEKDKSDELKFAVVKHIIDVRKAEAQKAEKARANKAEKQKILAIIAEKETEGLRNTSLNELREMVKNL